MLEVVVGYDVVLSFYRSTYLENSADRLWHRKKLTFSHQFARLCLSSSSSPIHELLILSCLMNGLALELVANKPPHMHRPSPNLESYNESTWVSFIACHSTIEGLVTDEVHLQ